MPTPLENLHPGDLPAPKKPKLWHSLLLGGVLGLVLITLDLGLLLKVSSLTLLLLIPGWYLSVAIHEGGHFLAAIAVGHRVTAYSVGWLLIAREQSGWKLRRSHYPLAGYVLALPDWTKNLRLRHAIVVAAGPAATLLLLLATIGLGRRIDGPVQALTGAIGSWAACQLALFVFPSRTLLMTDQKQLKVLASNGQDCKRHLANLSLLAMSGQGVRPRDYPESLALMGCDGALDTGLLITARVCRYNHCADSGKLEVAEADLAWIIQQNMDPMARAIWRAEVVWFAAYHRKDAALAWKWSEAGSGREPPAVRYARLKAESALAMVELRYVDAIRLITEARGIVNPAEAGIEIATTEALDQMCAESVENSPRP